MSYAICVGGNVPTDSNDQAFYTLGINVAMQVGTDLKNILSADEIALVARGFSDSMNGQVADEMTLLRANGPKINEILQSRVSNQLNDEKKKGEDFATKYLLSNPRATKTPSGLIYHEVIAGIGKQVIPSSHLHMTISVTLFCLLLPITLAKYQLQGNCSLSRYLNRW